MENTRKYRVLLRNDDGSMISYVVEAVSELEARFKAVYEYGYDVEVFSVKEVEE